MPRRHLATLAEYERHIKHCLDIGFTAFKLHAWGDVNRISNYRVPCAAGQGPMPT